MSKSLKANFVLSLEDQLSGGLAKLNKALSALGDLGKRLNLDPLTSSGAKIPGLTQAVNGLGRGLEAVATAAGRAEAALARMWKSTGSKLKGLGERIGPVGSALAGVSVLGPIEHWGDYSNTLRHIAITQGKTGPDVETEIGRLRKMFYEDALGTGQSSRSIAEAYSELIQIKIPANILDTVIKAHSRAATAYNISPIELGPAVGALIQNLHVPEDQIGGALAAMAVASREGRFKVADFSREFPGVAAQLSGWQMHGRDAANVGFAALQTVMKNSSIPSVAATDFSVALRDLGTPAGLKSWQNAMGFNLLPFLTRARLHGENPIDAVLGAIHSHTNGMNPEQTRGFMGKLFHGQQQADAWLALLQHEGDYRDLLKTLRGVGPDTLEKNFVDAFRDPISQVRIFKELLGELGDTIGVGFVPVLNSVNKGLIVFTKFVQDMEAAYPKLTEWTLTGVAALSALTVVLGAANFILPVIAGGFAIFGTAIGAIFSPVGLLAMAIAGLIVYWDDLSNAMGTWGSRVGPLLLRDFHNAWDPIGSFFASQFQTIESGFSDFTQWVTSWAEGPVHAIMAAFDKLRSWFSTLWADCSRPFDVAMAAINTALQRIGFSPTTAAPSGTGTLDAPAYVGDPSPWGGFSVPSSAHSTAHVTVDFNNAPVGTTVTAAPGVSVRLHGGDVAPNLGRSLDRDGHY